jgi:molecular chaperone DnaJ
MYEKEHGTSSQSFGGYGNTGGYGQTGGGQGYWGYGGFGNYGSYGGSQQQSQQGQYQDEDALKYRAAMNYINAGSYTEALHVLESMSNRSAQWYYLSAIANARMGSNINAKEYAKRAVEMEPNNMQYRQLLSQLESGGQWYQDMGQSYGMPNINLNDLCCKIICLSQCCCPGTFCCGPGIYH